MTELERLNWLLPPVLTETDLEAAQELREHLPKWLQVIATYHASVGLELRNMLDRTAGFIQEARRDYLALHADYVTLHGAVKRLVDAHQQNAPLPWEDIRPFLS